MDALDSRDRYINLATALIEVKSLRILVGRSIGRIGVLPDPSINQTDP